MCNCFDIAFKIIYFIKRSSSLILHRYLTFCSVQRQYLEQIRTLLLEFSRRHLRCFILLCEVKESDFLSSITMT